MPLDQHIRKLGTPLYGLFKKRGLSSTTKQSSVVRMYSRLVRALHVHWRMTPPSLPVELWMNIIHELCHREWMALCRVCWLFYRIAQPCLYENTVLRIRENIHREISNGSIDPHQQFRRTIDQRPDLGACVRNLTLYMDDRPGPNDAGRSLLLFGLRLFSGLESLDVWYIHLDLELCNILHSHPRLKSVKVTYGTLDESLATAGMDSDHFLQSPISMVKILEFEHDPPVHAWAALAPAKLESLEVQSCTFSQSDAGLILDSIRRSNKTSFLTTLSLDTFSPAVVHFLIASPQLRHLAFGLWRSEFDMSSSLPADAIPFLEEYSGPVEISSSFIRGRPVHKVMFISTGYPRIPEDHLVETLISLQYCTVPLTSLRLNLFQVTVGSWLSHIPATVHHLKLFGLHWSDFEKWLPALSHLTSLQTLSGEFSGQICRKLGRNEIMQIANTCQSLREIYIKSLRENNNGRRRWRVGGQRVWEPFRVFMTEV